MHLSCSIEYVEVSKVEINFFLSLKMFLSKANSAYTGEMLTFQRDLHCLP